MLQLLKINPHVTFAFSSSCCKARCAQERAEIHSAENGLHSEVAESHCPHGFPGSLAFNVLASFLSCCHTQVDRTSAGWLWVQFLRFRGKELILLTLLLKRR